jgi:hypothetical protein
MPCSRKYATLEARRLREWFGRGASPCRTKDRYGQIRCVRGPSTTMPIFQPAPDVQKSTRNPLTRDEARRIAVIQKIYRLGIFRTQVTIEIDVRFGAHFGHNSDIAQCLRWAKTRLMHRSKECAYSMTSSALACSNCGTVRPNALAVFIPHKLSQGCGLQAITSSTGAVALRPGKEACRLWSKSREPSA